MAGGKWKWELDEHIVVQKTQGNVGLGFVNATMPPSSTSQLFSKKSEAWSNTSSRQEEEEEEHHGYGTQQGIREAHCRKTKSRAEV
jgi:hypothetical protein